MKGKVFLDSNLWVYLNSNDAKAIIVRELVSSYFATVIVSSQVLGEIYHVLVKKGIAVKETAQEIIRDLQESFNVSPITSETVNDAMRINSQYGFSYWDSLIIAAALETGCAVLYSEDLQHKQKIDGKLTIVNPFA